MTFRWFGVASGVLVIACGASRVASGAGIAIMEQSVQELGQAFAGAPTNVDDGSAVFFNPGAMGKMRDGLVTGAGYVIIPSVRFHDRGSRVSPQVGGAPLTGNSGGEGGVTTLVANLYYVQEISERFVFGIGINSPFGVHSDYDPAWRGRYQAIESLIETINFNPSLAFRLNDQLSFGAGIDIQYLHAKLTNALDFGTVCLQALGPTRCAQNGLLPQQADGHLKVEGDGVGVGYNLGLLFSPTETTRIGVSYRSGINQGLTGDADFTVPAQAQPLTGTGRFVDSPVRAPVALPDSVLFGFHHQFDDQWAVTADALWTHWSRIKSLTVKFPSGQPISAQPLDWQDTWRGAVGVNYLLQPGVTVRVGVAYDQSPIPNALLRTPRIPDSDRVWLTAGVTYRPLEEVTLHGGYAHLFFQDAPTQSRGLSGDQLIGTFSDQIDIVGLQLDWRF